MALLRVGILADNRLQQHVLNTCLQQVGIDVAVSADPSRMALLDGSNLQLDAWLVTLTETDNVMPDWLEELLEGDVPVLLGFDRAPPRGCAEFVSWQDRFVSKLQELPVRNRLDRLTSQPTRSAHQGDSSSTTERHTEPTDTEVVSATIKPTYIAPGNPDSPGTESDQSIADNTELYRPGSATDKEFEEARADVAEEAQRLEEVWVLGASLGGPAAISRFLEALPKGLPVAFVYAQHIDPRFESTLKKTIGRRSEYRLYSMEAGCKLAPGRVLIVPIEEELLFDKGGRPMVLGNPWSGHYSPNINQVMLNVSRAFGHRCGHILFSGMGDDGAEAARELAHSGCPIWVQSPDSCANASMVESVIETQNVNFMGDPDQLALQLVNRFNQQQDS